MKYRLLLSGLTLLAFATAPAFAATVSACQKQGTTGQTGTGVNGYNKNGSGQYPKSNTGSNQGGYNKNGYQQPNNGGQMGGGGQMNRGGQMGQPMNGGGYTRGGYQQPSNTGVYGGRQTGSQQTQRQNLR